MLRSGRHDGAIGPEERPARPQETFITIGTGGQTGVYLRRRPVDLPSGEPRHGRTRLRCTAPSTGGSIANINAIAAGDMDMGVAQSDWQFHAYNGSSEFEGNAMPESAGRVSRSMASPSPLSRVPTRGHHLRRPQAACA